jgi:Family of unknown function (DUF6152)
MKIGNIALVAPLLLAAAPLFAHHSIAGYFDTSQRNTIEGTVAAFEYQSPHAWVHVESVDAKTGQKQMWNIEWSPVRRLERQGVTRDSLKPGDHVTIVGYPSRKPNDRALHMVSIVRQTDGWKWSREMQQ